jgi:hypothetical protein
MKTYAILVTCLLVGIFISFVSVVWVESESMKLFLREFASFLTIGGGLGILERALHRHDLFLQLRRLFLVHQSVDQYGISLIERDANHYDYAPIVRTSPYLAILLNDGRTWLSSRVLDMRHRFSKEGHVTEFFVPDPAGKFIDVIAQKTGYTREQQVEKIEQAKKRLIEEYVGSGKKGVLKIYHMPHFPTHSVFLGSEEAIMTTYGSSSGRRAVPVLVFKKIGNTDCLYEDIKDDISTLKKESACVYPSDCE